MHCSVYYSLLVFLFLSDDRHVSSLAHSQPDSISAILESYANAFTTGKPIERYVSTPIFLNNYETRPSTLVHDFTTVRPEDRRRVVVTQGYSNVEPKVADSNAVRNNYKASYEELDEDGDPKGPPDHLIPFTEHENPREPSTKPNYTAPGDWAKPAPEKNIGLDFVPTKLYAQVRGTHTVRHLPQEVAINNAQTDEEKENAARLREVLKVSKANTVYTEEGYEDAAYDHAGQIRDADFHEGFARKLKEESDKKKSYDGDRPKKPKKPKKNKNRKGKLRERYDDDYIDHLEEEVFGEARLSKKQVKPENLKALRNALKAPAIDAKTAAESGIHQLERDLKEESREIEGTSTEPYFVPSTTFRPIVVETTLRGSNEPQTTTEKREIFTVRPRRPPTERSRSIVAKIRRPVNNYYPPANSGNHNVYSDEPTTVNYGNLFWQYFLNKQNQTPAVTYRPIFADPSQTVSPVIANPLAVATVNGHGPYLVVVTAPPSTNPPGYLEGQGSETTVSYVTAPSSVNATTRTTARNNNPFLHYEALKLDVAEQRNKSNNAEVLRKDKQEPKPEERIVNEKKQKNSSKNPKYKSASNQEKLLDYVKSDKSSYRDYYTAMQPPKITDVPIKYSDYSRRPYSNMLEQWPVKHESESPVESVYDVMNGNEHERPREQPAAQKSASPVTRLLPPAPLFSSEYASFHMHGRRASEPAPPQTLVSIMPIIQAIRKRESQRKPYLPFLFRKKRSTAHGHTREWEIEQRDKRLDEAKLAKIVDSGSERNEAKALKRKPPRNFERLLNQSPRVTGDVVEKEIEKRFRDKSKDQSSSEEYSDEISKEKLRSEDDSKGEDVVEVDLPELDFSSAFEEDEFEPTTRRPGIDTEKYPFYRDSKFFENSPLKYAVNPAEVPRKTLGGMEFYDSRSLECEEIDPNLEKIVPEEEELAEKRGPRKSKPRLHGLGDKVDCFKAKYFDENPLDSPLFFEETIENPTPPAELDPKKFASRILELPAENEEYVVQRGPKSPEDFGSIKRSATIVNSPRQYYSEQNNKYNYAPRSRRPGSIEAYPQKNRRPPSAKLEENNDEKVNKTRSRPKSKKSNQKISPPYQRQVYEDVMGTIMNLENMYKPHGHKHKRIPSHPKHRIREHYDQQENNKFDLPLNRRPSNIDGLVPPPKREINVSPYHGNKYGHPNQRNNRYAYNERPTRHLRLYKRNVDSEEAKEVVITAKSPTSTSEKPEKSTFRIIMTMPPTEKPKKKRKAVTIITDEPTTQRTVYTINDRLKSDRTDDPGKHDKFSYNSSSNSSVDPRRNEPRYNVPTRRNFITDDLNTTSSPVKLELPKVTSQASVGPAYSSSTLIPVIAIPDESLLSGVPQESKNSFTKEKLTIPDNIDLQAPSNDYIDEASESKPEVKTPQYSVHEKIEEEPTDDKNEEGITEFTMLPESEEEHKELYEFLQGDPPGYDKAFTDESTTEFEEKPFTVQRRAESQAYPRKIDNAKSEEDDEAKEIDTGESTTEEVEEEPIEEVQLAKSEEEGTTKSSNESESEPFVRYSSRPYSPPENYEDEQYSELGPRINKPSFYHPPFEVPEYEKRVLGKTVDRADEEGWGHSAEETEDHEKYVFPWENDKEDEEEEKGEESKDFSILGRYEFPWEKRERKEREKRAKAKLHKERYGVEYVDPEEEDEADGENGTEATNTRAVFVPLKNKLSRGKKDVNNLEVSTENRPHTKFSSKYKSGVVRIPFEDDEMSITVANTDNIKDSILSYLERIDSSTPKIKNSPISQKNVLNDTFFMSATTNLPYRMSRKNDFNLKFESSTLNSHGDSTPKPERISTVTPTPTTITTARNQVRARGSRRHATTNASVGDIARISHGITENQVTSTPASRNIRRRGRTRDNPSSSTTTASSASTTSQAATSSPIYGRRRGRPTTTSATPTNAASTTTSTRAVPMERRRRPFRVAGMDKANSPSSATTLSSLPTSTGRTIEHHSRVSKEEIITKTSYQDEEDEGDDDEDDNVKTASDKKPVKYSKIKRQNKPKNESDNEPPEHGTMKEKVEKVTITMEETPNHVFRTKEIDKDGVKGKFVTITANTNNNNGSSTPSSTKRNGDAEMEEMKRRMNAFNSFDSVIRDTEDQTDQPSGLHGAEVSDASPRRHRETRVTTRGYKHMISTAVSWESEGEPPL